MNAEIETGKWNAFFNGLFVGVVGMVMFYALWRLGGDEMATTAAMPVPVDSPQPQQTQTLITAAALSAWLLDGGIVMQGGAVVLCEDCPCVEEGPVIETECCPNPIPETLTVLITDKTGDCTCLPDSIEAVYRPGGIGWEAKITCNGVTRDYRWDCADPALGPEDFIFVPAADIAETSYTPDEYSCNPFRLKFNNIDLSVHCSGTATFTIQE